MSGDRLVVTCRSLPYKQALVKLGVLLAWVEAAARLRPPVALGALQVGAAAVLAAARGGPTHSARRRMGQFVRLLGRGSVTPGRGVPHPAVHELWPRTGPWRQGVESPGGRSGASGAALGRVKRTVVPLLLVGEAQGAAFELGGHAPTRTPDGWQRARCGRARWLPVQQSQVPLVRVEGDRDRLAVAWGRDRAVRAHGPTPTRSWPGDLCPVYWPQVVHQLRM